MYDIVLFDPTNLASPARGARRHGARRRWVVVVAGALPRLSGRGVGARRCMGVRERGPGRAAARARGARVRMHGWACMGTHGWVHGWTWVHEHVWMGDGAQQ